MCIERLRRETEEVHPRLKPRLTRPEHGHVLEGPTRIRRPEENVGWNRAAEVRRNSRRDDDLSIPMPNAPCDESRRDGESSPGTPYRQRLLVVCSSYKLNPSRDQRRHDL